MSFFRKLFFTITIILSIPSILFLLPGIFHIQVYRVVFWVIVLSILWSGYFFAMSNFKYSLQLSILAVLLLLAPLSHRFISRFIFMAENHGMEGPNGLGSPMAFLIGFVTESFFFLPLMFLFITGLIVLFRSKALPNKPKQSDSN